LVKKEWRENRQRKVLETERAKYDIAVERRKERKEKGEHGES